MEERPLTTTYDDATMTLVVSGSVDETSVDLLREAIDKHSSSLTQRLSINLGDVDFLPSLGIGVLVGAMRIAQDNGAAVELVATPGCVAQQVLSMCGLPHREN